MKLKEVELQKISLAPNETLFVKVKGKGKSPNEAFLKEFHNHLQQHFGADRVITVDVTGGEMEFTKITRNENT
jgi:predicted TIM-barrel fold metal-dependent hydrolase